jgi:putative hydrolase of the HAD superfamily
MPDASATVRAVVFDLDDTLYGERDYVRSGYRAIAEHLERSAPHEARASGVHIAPTYETWLWNRFLDGQSRNAFDELNSRFGLDLTSGRILELVALYRRHRPDIRPADGVPEMLGCLHARFRLALLSDGYLPGQQLKLDALGLRRFFDVVVFTEEIGRAAWKPSPVGFQLVLDKLAVPGESAAYVADNPAKDFIAPNQLGWRTIQFVRPGQIHSSRPAPHGGAPQFVVRSPGELLAALLRPKGHGA